MKLLNQILNRDLCFVFLDVTENLIANQDIHLLGLFSGQTEIISETQMPEKALYQSAADILGPYIILQ